MDEWQFERLDRSYERGEFSCGKAPLDEFLHSLCTQYEKRRLGRTYVAVLPGEKKVRGYYTLAAGAIPLQDLPPAIAKKLPKHPVPAAVLGRLAIDKSVQGRGLGEALLMNALRRCLELSDQLGLFAVAVRALDDAAKGFYLKYGFVPLADHELHLFLPMKTFEEAFGGSRKKG